MRPDALAGTYRCSGCGLYRSAFPVAINQAQDDRLDEVRRERALKALRVANFERLLDGCAAHLAEGASLLDVGCAHGWFLEAAARRGYRPLGLEPDREVAARTKASGAPVIEGFFPDALPAGASYDAISFNDVFEHLPDAHAMAEAVRERLNPGGMLILNLPLAGGVIFQLARLAARLGIKGPLARMWQEGLPSPHLAYYTSAAVLRLFRAHGFEPLAHGRLPSMTAKGLWARIRYDRSVSPVKAVGLYVVAAALAVVSDVLPPDIGYFVLRKSASPA
ncbi:MAG TPA: class I SAM-dependent methyltransferase [Phenylobacterium sp.]|uniref:class I SAM-dependent methyltransferase n=1 Tax=Phenylobacterium sp. TaxID=1871053 RepID=UPI002B4A09AF|nr:class I SAM-dependent methyltransferase [Phenylobacterium sp.]HKR89380.1 class I SAM-dependent methyltransferase [Phenylobacterium sp.]